MSAPSTRTTGIALAAIGSALLANGAWFAPILLSMDPSAKLSEYGGQLPFRLYYYGYLATLVAFVLLVPSFGRLRGRTGRTLPRWLPGLLVIMTVLQIATVYTQAFVVPFLAKVAPVALDHEGIDLFAITMMVIWSGFGLTLVALGVVGSLRRVVPVTTAVVVAVGALVTPILGPVGSILIGGGMVFWAGSRLLRSPSPLASTTETVSPVTAHA